jgi:hypothetical protein
MYDMVNINDEKREKIYDEIRAYLKKADVTHIECVLIFHQAISFLIDYLHSKDLVKDIRETTKNNDIEAFLTFTAMFGINLNDRIMEISKK